MVQPVSLLYLDALIEEFDLRICRCGRNVNHKFILDFDWFLHR